MGQWSHGHVGSRARGADGTSEVHRPPAIRSVAGLAVACRAAWRHRGHGRDLLARRRPGRCDVCADRSVHPASAAVRATARVGGDRARPEQARRTRTFTRRVARAEPPVPRHCGLRERRRPARIHRWPMAAGQHVQGQWRFLRCARRPRPQGVRLAQGIDRRRSASRVVVARQGSQFKSDSSRGSHDAPGRSRVACAWRAVAELHVSVQNRAAGGCDVLRGARPREHDVFRQWRHERRPASHGHRAAAAGYHAGDGARRASRTRQLRPARRREPVRLAHTRHAAARLGCVRVRRARPARVRGQRREHLRGPGNASAARIRDARGARRVAPRHPAAVDRRARHGDGRGDHDRAFAGVGVARRRVVGDSRAVRHSRPARDHGARQCVRSARRRARRPRRLRSGGRRDEAHDEFSIVPLRRRAGG